MYIQVLPTAGGHEGYEALQMVVHKSFVLGRKQDKGTRI